MKQRKKRLVLYLLIFLTLYVASYLVISRLAYAKSASWNLDGFFYVTPSQEDNEPHWLLKHQLAVSFFWPINQLDQWIGTGMAPIRNVPLFELS